MFQRQSEFASTPEKSGISRGSITMDKQSKKTEPFLFFREGHFYPVEIPRDQVLANVELNPGTLKVEDLKGNVIWRLQ
jgi:hypothetical protein